MKCCFWVVFFDIMVDLGDWDLDIVVVVCKYVL